tara:strand:+ start:783 stop:1037 length:255 start_codon:yes stop_codon:yes gene_type:complete
MDKYDPAPLTFATTDELVQELHRRHPVMMLIFEKDASPDDRSTLNIYGPEGTAAGVARALGLLEAAKQQMGFDFLLLQKIRDLD